MQVETFDLAELPRHLPPALDPAAVVSLAAIRTGVVNPSGSGVAITPNLVVTAGHVVDDYLATVQADAPWGVQGSSALSPAHKHRAWHFGALQRMDESDLAILVSASMNPPFMTLQPATLCLTPPEPGEEVFALGFHSSRMEPQNEPNTYLWHEMPALSRGNVIDVYPQRRDSAMAPFPCFSLGIDIFGGMSGGPVFNSSGQVLGFISSGITGETYAVATLVWPLLAMHFSEPALGYGYAPTLYEAVLRGQVLACGIRRVFPSFDEAGVLTQVALLERPA